MSPRTAIAVALALTCTPCLTTADPIISEFMASNRGAVVDGDGEASDWIELHNPTASEIDLAGWKLRDSANTWSFPDPTPLAAGAYLVVFASGQDTSDYVDAGGFLHTDFKLDAAGEAIALLRPDNTIAAQLIDVPPQRENVSYGLLSETEPLLSPNSAARHLIPSAPVDDAWRTPGFDDSAWAGGTASIGFNLGSGPVLGGGAGSHTAYLVLPDTPGNQAYSGSLGMDFITTEELRITQLGVFDDGSDGLASTLTAQLWRRDTNGTPNHFGDDSGAGNLATLTFTPGSPGTLDGGSRFKPLAEPLVLPPGDYSMVAYGYGASERNANQGVAELEGLDIDTAGGAIQFVGTSRFGTAGQFPTTADGGPANRYAAGTFKFSPGSASDIGTDVGATMSGTSASALLRVPFDVSDPTDTDTFQLDIGFDDGFVAWINGIEIARHNAPPEVDHDSRATAPGNGTRSLPAAVPEGTLLPGGNILAIHGLNVDAGDSDFIASVALSGITTDTLTARYFTSPTAGAPNDPSGIIGFLEDTEFSVDRGFFDAPFELAITTATGGTQIRYTTDGSEPTEENGTDYTGPLTINGTTVLRAAAFKDGFAPTNVDTQTYLFLDEVAVRDNSPAGYPISWGGIAADYAMDQDPSDFARAAGTPGASPAEAQAAIVASLKSIPTLSIVTDIDHLFGAGTGIYLNPSGRGAAWERPVSVEMIGADGAGQFQIDAGLRIMGFTSRNLGTTPKLNMRLLFKSEYGAARLDYPLLGPDGPDRFNTIALRGNIRDAWVTERFGFGSATYIGDEWAKRAQSDMGQPAVRGTFMHLYLNGIYWGLYNPTERPDDDFAETHLGGDRSEYDVVKFCCPDRSTAGTIAMWDALLAESRAGLGDTASYQRIQGNHPDGSPNPAFPVLIDVDNFIDYLINGQYHAQGDWPGNYYVIRDQVPGRSEGFKYFTWDNDHPFAGGNPNSGNKVQPSPGHNWWTESPGEMDIALRANADYRIRFADRAYRHYFHGGAMTVENNIARWQELAALVRPALFAESARWGDAKGSVLRTVQDHWDARNTAMVENYFPNRQAVVFNQLRAHDLYPEIEAPEFNRRGGVVAPGFGLRFDAQATVYYTNDGSDPRLPGGAINPVAQPASSATEQTTLVDTGAGVRAWVPEDDRYGTAWRERGFDDSSWTSGTTGVGYEGGSGYAGEISLDLIGAMHNENQSVYLRIPFAGANPAEFQSLTLRMKYDDGFVAFLNGVQIAARNAPAQLSPSAGATGSHNDQLALAFEEIDVSAHLGLLDADSNVLAIHGLNFGLGSSDFLIVPELVGISLAGGDTVSLGASATIRARAFDGSEWSALNEATFIVGTPPDASNLVVSELMYHPEGTAAGAEFIELMNISPHHTLDLTGMAFSDGIEFEFPVSFTLAPLARTLVVRDRTAFAARYGEGFSIAGSFANGSVLDNGGERIALSSAGGGEFLAFDYDDRLPWPESPDGAGPSLVLIDPTSNPDHGNPTSWRPSTHHGGKPGQGDAEPLGGDPAADLDGDGLNAFLEHALGTSDTSPGRAPLAVEATPDGPLTLSFPRNLGADEAQIEIQWSADLLTWTVPDDLELIDATHGGDGIRHETWRLGKAGSARRFARLLVRSR